MSILSWIENQRKLNFGKSVDQDEHKKRFIGRHIKHLKVNLTPPQVIYMHLPPGIIPIVYEIKDVYGNIIPPHTKQWKKHKPIIISLVCSEVHPDPLCRYDMNSLDSIITEYFGKYIVSEKVDEREQKGINEVLFRHEGFLQHAENTDNEKPLKHAFNVRNTFIYQHELDALNERLKIIGHKEVSHKDALKLGEKNINNSQKIYFEFGEF